MTECPNCGKDREQLGTHWAQSKSCEYPELSDYQHEVATGVLMGDGYIKETHASNYLAVQMVTEEYLSYLSSNVFPVTSSGVSCNCRNIYTWRTRTLPEFQQYRDWYKSGSKTFPKDIELTPTTLKHWYVCDGSLAERKNTEHIRIGLSNERKNEEKIRRYFDSIGVHITNWGDYDSGCSAIFNSKQSDKLWNYMGGPLPGFEYKWPDRYK